MSTMVSQITSLTIVYSIVYSDADQRKHENSASLAFVRGIHRGPVNSSHKWPVTWKMFPFDDVIMGCWWFETPRYWCDVNLMCKQIVVATNICWIRIGADTLRVRLNKTNIIFTVSTKYILWNVPFQRTETVLKLTLCVFPSIYNQRRCFQFATFNGFHDPISTSITQTLTSLINTHRDHNNWSRHKRMIIVWWKQVIISKKWILKNSSVINTFWTMLYYLLTPLSTRDAWINVLRVNKVLF